MQNGNTITWTIDGGEFNTMEPGSQTLSEIIEKPLKLESSIVQMRLNNTLPINQQQQYLKYQRITNIK